MAYLRQKGQQLVIVHGIRDPETKKVEQKTLFTFYSKAEALAAMGRIEGLRNVNFERLVERANPDIRIDWSKVFAQLEEKMHVLPDLWNYHEGRLKQSFRSSLVSFGKLLMQADGQTQLSSAQVIEENRYELEYLRKLIDWRLQSSNLEEDEWNRDTPFFWFHALPPDQVPPDEEERAWDLLDEGRLDEAESLFRFFVECFPRYADGYNGLGTVHQRQGELEDAIQMYEMGMRVGRKLFRKRMPKKAYWDDHSTRPYMRAMRNLTGALIEARRYQEALQLCDRQENECGDITSADWYRGFIYMNLQDWEAALGFFLATTGLWPERNVLAAFAAYHLRRFDEAGALYLCGLLNHPLAARMVLHLPVDRPSNWQEGRDYNAGVDWLRSLDDYLKHRPASAKLYFLQIAEDEHTLALEEELRMATEQWQTGERPGSSEGFERMQEMRSRDFASREIGRIIGS